MGVVTMMMINGFCGGMFGYSVAKQDPFRAIMAFMVLVVNVFVFSVSNGYGTLV